MFKKNLLVTHHAPDLDAIGSVWLLKRFESQKFATTQVAFVNPGSRISLEEAEQFGCQLHEATHVDTGLGQFDHHQPERGDKQLSASLLIYQYLCIENPTLIDDAPLAELVRHITDVDHFGEVNWPGEVVQQSYMLHEIIRGCEFVDPHNDESQLHFGLQCLDNAYAVLKQYFKAEEIIKEKGQEFSIGAGKALGILTRNDDTIKLAQKKGYQLVIRKDSQQGNIRIKARPDSDINLKQLDEEIKKIDTTGTWYFHPSGKMLINGSRKHRNQLPSPLSLEEVIALVKKIYA
jgi:hypothetical protein